jgi:hypothetical protein
VVPRLLAASSRLRLGDVCGREGALVGPRSYRAEWARAGQSGLRLAKGEPSHPGDGRQDIGNWMIMAFFGAIYAVIGGVTTDMYAKRRCASTIE